MILCAAGDIHGAMDKMYEDVLAFEGALGVRFEWVLHVGDFGVWPDANRIDKATKKHDGAGDFPSWFAERRAAPRKTVFIKGNHEDFVWLDAQRDAQVLPGLFYLRNGSTMDLGESPDVVRVAGVGGCHGPSDFERESKRLQGYAKRHYTRDEIETLSNAVAVDILLVHDAPAGVRFERHRRGIGWVSEAAGLDKLVANVRPKICFFGHHHTRVDAEVANVRCIGLNKVRMPGNLVAIDFQPRGREWSILGEWSPTRKTGVHEEHPMKKTDSQPEPVEPIDDPPELTREDFEHMLRSDQRKRIIAGHLQVGDVAALRRFVRLTQEQFAEALGISVHTLRNWEQDRVTPDGPGLALLRITARDPSMIRKNLASGV